MYVEGAANLVIDEQDKERLRQLLATLEEKQRIVDLLSAYLDTRQEAVRVVVGLEDAMPHLSNFVLIGTPARVGDEVMGSLAVIGPTRMDYEHTITAVSYIARMFDQLWNGVVVLKEGLLEIIDEDCGQPPDLPIGRERPPADRAHRQERQNRLQRAP